MAQALVTLQAAGQSLALVPGLGGGIAHWRLRRGGGWHELLRPWSGASEDRYTLASFAMLPWSNRISHGGFRHRGCFHAMAPNRAGEPYPIHGDGWLQPWSVAAQDARSVELRLSSDHFRGSPYRFDAVQRFTLLDDGLAQSISVCHRGAGPLPYGLGLHPWFPRTAQGSVTARVAGVWLCGDDPIPTAATRHLPPGWDLNAGAPMHGSLIDNACFGWDGVATIAWPEHGLALRLSMAPLQAPQGRLDPAYCLVYRPPVGEAFCFEPISQPIDAFHLPGQPGLVELRRDETLTMALTWTVVSAA